LKKENHNLKTGKDFNFSLNIYSPELRRKFLIYLFGLAVILLALNLLFKNKIDFSSTSDKEISAEDISNRFINILNNFGIEEKLIKKTISKDNISGLNITKFIIQVPKDLSIPEILLDVFNEFRKDSLKIESVEKIKGSKSILKIINGDEVVLLSEFDYSKNISREKKYFSLIISDFELENENDSALIESSSSVNFLIRPNSKYKDLINYIKSYKKEFSLIIDDDTEEQKYKLAAGYSEQRIINVLKTLVKDYSKASFFIIDDRSELFSSSNYKILNTALSKRQIKLFKLSGFITLDESDSWLDELNNKMERVSNNESSIFLVHKDSYMQLRSKLSDYYKKGYRIVNSSLLFWKDN
jgi:hypothetical protein